MTQRHVMVPGDRQAPHLRDVIGDRHYVPLKYSVRLNPEVLEEATPLDMPIRYIDISSVESGTGRTSTEDFEFGNAPSRARRRLRSGDVFVSTVRTYLKAIGYCEERANDLICSTGFAVLRAGQSVCPRFLYHWCSSEPFVAEVVSRSTGVSYPAINASEIGQLPLPAMPLEEQRRIADFLDRKTAEIDALIAKKERMIALLNEKRQAVLMHGVTSGVGASLSTVPTGSQWLRTMPSHWKGLPLKRLVATPITDGPHETPTLVAEGVPFLSAEAVSNGRLDFALMRGFISLDDHRLFCRKCKPRRDDVLLCKSGATTGKVAIVTTDEEFSVWSPLALIRAHPEKLLPRFIYHAITARYVQTQIQNLWSFGTQPNIGMNVIERLWIAVPPMQEQETIARWIDSSLSESDHMVNRLVRSMALLREYRQALISEAVSGRVDMVASLQSSAIQLSGIADEAVTSAPTGEHALFPEVFEQPPDQETPARAARAVSPAFKRTVLAAELISRMHDDPAFHKIKFQKTLFLAEYHLQLPSMETHYLRDAAGPHDNASMRSIESQLRKQKWYDMRKVDGQFVFEPLEKAGGHAIYFPRYWSEYSDQLDSLLALLRRLDTTQAEIVATLYAAWNDFLIRGVAFDDAMIVQEVLTNWNPAKERITEDRWHKGLGWMREKGLVPTGFGEVTTKKGGEPA